MFFFYLARREINFEIPFYPRTNSSFLEGFNKSQQTNINLNPTFDVQILTL